MSVLYIFIEIWLVEVTCLNAYALTCARINGLKRFNQLSLSRNSFFYLYSVSFNLFVEYLTFIQITSRGCRRRCSRMNSWPIRLSFSRIFENFSPKNGIFVEILWKNEERIWGDSYENKNFNDFEQFQVMWFHHLISLLQKHPFF